MKSALKKWSRRAGGALLGLLAIGVASEQVARARFNSQRPPPEQFLAVDGRNVHFVRKGTGGPCVVFEAGLGADHMSWASVQDEVARFTSTLSYDRAGLLWSDFNPDTPTLQTITRDFSAVLEHSQCPKPYILVGHSLAGITLRPFIRDHAADIAGIVFVDVAHPRMLELSSEQLKQLLVTPPQWLIATMVNTGVFRAVYSLTPLVPDFPVSDPVNRHARQSFFRSYRAILQLARADDPMFVEAGAIDSFGDIPLTVVTATYPHGNNIADPALEREYQELHQKLQADLLRLSTHSRQVLATRSSHYVPQQQPELIVEAIRDLLPSARDQ